MSKQSNKIIEQMIYLIRNQKVMLDSDLALLYNVPTKALNQAVKRHHDRFPSDFMFRLTKEENQSLRSQSVTFKNATANRKHLPNVFTEYGIASLSGVLNSEIASRVNVRIIRTFIKMRKILNEDQSILDKIDAIEKGTNKLFTIIFNRLDDLDNSQEILAPKRKKIGIKNTG